MKKWLIVVVVVAGLSLTSVYVFFPKLLNISNKEKINCNINGVNRFLMADDKWAKWWPGTVEHDSLSNKNIFVYKGYRYVITGNRYNTIVIKTIAEGFTIDGTILFLQLNPDSVQAEWTYSLQTNSNPINRIILYRETRKVNNNMKAIMKSMKAFMEKQENIYGITLDIVMSGDSTLVATKCETKSYPSTAEIYNLVGDLKQYILSQGAKENNFPMLNVRKVNDSNFETMVAIPVNKYLPGNGKIFFRRFVPWKVLMAEVRGGTYTVNEALNQMRNYISDYQKITMAIPFESLVTDRSKQPDTSQWITRIYTPVPR